MKLALELPDGLIVQAAPPTLLSQHNCAHVGMTRADYLRALARAEASGVKVISSGKLRLVDCAAFVAWLKSASESAARGTPTPSPANDLEGELDELLGVERRRAR